jgi:hypothetical protein
MFFNFSNTLAAISLTSGICLFYIGFLTAHNLNFGWEEAFVCYVFGIFFFASGFITLYRIYSVWRLIKNGKVIQATITKLYQDKRYSMSRTIDWALLRPWVIEAEWQDGTSPKKWSFISDHLWYDFSDGIKGKTIPVHINPSNPKIYWVDTSSLPKKPMYAAPGIPVQ